MKGLQLWSGALLLYLLALAATMPATLLDAGLDARTTGRLRLTAAQGTLWSGKGQIESQGGDGSAGFTRSVQWHLDPGQLMLARLAWRVVYTTDQPPALVSASWSGIEIKQLDLELPIATAVQIWPVLRGYGLGGLVQMHVDMLAFSADASEGSATLQWHGASTGLAPVSPLGSYELRLEGNGAGIGISLHTLQGPLRLEGKGSVGRTRRPVFVAVAQVEPAERELLAPFLRLFAVENADGNFAFELN